MCWLDGVVHLETYALACCHKFTINSSEAPCGSMLGIPIRLPCRAVPVRSCSFITMPSFLPTSQVIFNFEAVKEARWPRYSEAR